MKFVDRKKELHRLQRATDGHKGRLIVVYGRRRLGKSTLIKKILRDSDVYYEAAKSEAPIQRAALASAVSLVYPDFGHPVYPSWEVLLNALNNRCKEGSTLMLDEFPYLVERDHSLPSVIQRLVDSDKMRFNLILCGSSQRMMQKIVLQGSEPLYGRATESINLGPIRVQHWWHAFDMEARHIVEEYSVWGGVPRYWILREEYPSMERAIEQLVLDEHGVLSNEPETLFLDDVDAVAPYVSIMTAIGQGNTKISKIADIAGRKISELSPLIKNLISMHYIRKEVPFGEDIEKSKKTLYMIDDPFLDFYYRFVVPAKPLLSLGRTEVVMDHILRHMSEQVGHVWERLCQTAVSGNELFGHTWDAASRWWGNVPLFKEGQKTPIGHKEIEFDVVTEALDDKGTILVGECKWQAADHADRLLAQLKQKVSETPLAQAEHIVYVLFLKEKPLTEATCAVMLPEDVLNHLPE